MVGSYRTWSIDSILTWGLALVVVAEFSLLRTGTRALIHIPGLERFESPIRVLAEVGRLAYYLAVVFLLAWLVNSVFAGVRSGQNRLLALAAVTAAYLVISLAGRLGLVEPTSVGWFSLGVLAATVALTWSGIRSSALVLFVMASIAAGISVLGQGDGGGFSGSTVDTLVFSAEVLLILAALSTPLLVLERIDTTAMVAGVVMAVICAGALASAGSTISIIVLWNVGVPGWLPSAFYALAVGALTITIWSSLRTGHPTVAMGSSLLVAGGVGVISTYQMGLALAGLLLLAEALRRESDSRIRPQTLWALDRRVKELDDLPV